MLFCSSTVLSTTLHPSEIIMNVMAGKGKKSRHTVAENSLLPVREGPGWGRRQTGPEELSTYPQRKKEAKKERTTTII
jgi:hypothetical protein